MSLPDARRLVRAVGRAFYDDDAVVLLDALCRNEYLVDYEKAGRSPLEDRLGLQTKQIRTTLQLLYNDCLIERFVQHYRRADAAKGTRRRNHIFFYINYLHFVKLTRLRLHQMVRVIEDQEGANAAVDTLYFCPRCKLESDLVSAMEYQEADSDRFHCGRCFNDVFEVVFLEEIADKAGADRQAGVRTLKQKRQDQISDLPGFREGLEDLLHKIDLFPLPPPENLPREHIENEVDEHAARVARGGGQGGGPGGAKGGQGAGYTAGEWVNAAGQNVQVRLVSDVDEATALAAASAPASKRMKADEVDLSASELPAWMQRDQSGRTSSNAVQDAMERTAKKASHGAVAMPANVNVMHGGASSRLQQLQRQEQAQGGASGNGSAGNVAVGNASGSGAAGASASVEAPEPAGLKRSPSEQLLDEERLERERGITVLVAGKEMALSDVKPEDEHKMTPEEYDAYVAHASKGADDADEFDDDFS